MLIEPRRTGPEQDLCPAGLAQADWAAMDEAARCRAIFAAADPGAGVGPVPVAPAAGARKVTTPYALLPGGSRRREGHMGRSRVERADVFDRMVEAARRAHARRGEDAGPFVAPVTPGQAAIGRHYAGLVERHEAGAVRCASLEAWVQGGGGGGSVTDARLAEGREIAALRRRIGDGVAMSVRRVRPSARGAGAGAITDRALVDAVCLGDADLSDVLRRHGWSVDGKNREALRRALVGALDRMQGYR
jgi:hypothetical protein